MPKQKTSANEPQDYCKGKLCVSLPIKHMYGRLSALLIYDMSINKLPVHRIKSFYHSNRDDEDDHYHYPHGRPPSKHIRVKNRHAYCTTVCYIRTRGIYLYRKQPVGWTMTILEIGLTKQNLSYENQCDETNLRSNKKYETLLRSYGVETYITLTPPSPPCVPNTYVLRTRFPAKTTNEQRSRNYPKFTS